MEPLIQHIIEIKKLSQYPKHVEHMLTKEKNTFNKYS